jgi:hypothetical protein
MKYRALGCALFGLWIACSRVYAPPNDIRNNRVAIVRTPGFWAEPRIFIARVDNKRPFPVLHEVTLSPGKHGICVNASWTVAGGYVTGASCVWLYFIAEATHVYDVHVRLIGTGPTFIAWLTDRQTGARVSTHDR